MTAHRTSTGHIPEARAVSWSCTCGVAQILEYGLTVDGPFAVEVAERRAATHRTLTAEADAR